MEKNVLGKELETCSCSPMTGWFRDGLCRTEFRDTGVHTVCCVVTDEFLEFSRDQGNDLITPRPEFDFPGLVTGNKWCLCAGRWLDAYRAGKACPVDLNATHEETLAIIPIEILQEMEVKS